MKNEHRNAKLAAAPEHAVCLKGHSINFKISFLVMGSTTQNPFLTELRCVLSTSACECSSAALLNDSWDKNFAAYESEN